MKWLFFALIECAKPNPGDISTLAPTSFAEIVLGIYSKVPEYVPFPFHYIMWTPRLQIILYSEHYGDIQAAFREVLKELLSSADDTLSAIVGSPRTPIPNRTGSSSTTKTRDNTPTRDGAGTRTPFSENSFTTVPKSYVPHTHTSPSLTAAKKRGRGDDLDETPVKRKRGIRNSISLQ